MSKSSTAALPLRFRQLAESPIEEHVVLLAVQYEDDTPPVVEGPRYVTWGGPDDFSYYVCAKSGKHVPMARAQKDFINVADYTRILLGKKSVSDEEVDVVRGELETNAAEYRSGDEIESWPKYSEHELARKRKEKVDEESKAKKVAAAEAKATAKKKQSSQSTFNPQPKLGKGSKKKGSRKR